jgi:hypothetical protein
MADGLSAAVPGLVAKDGHTLRSPQTMKPCRSILATTLLLALFFAPQRTTKLQSGPTDAPVVTLPDDSGFFVIDSWRDLWEWLYVKKPTQWRSGPRG